MLTVLAHAGQPPQPHDLWSSWNLDPLIITALVGALFVHQRGRLAGPRRPADDRRAACFIAAIATLAVALLSPLDALSNALASAHMVQHILLVLVAAPLLALSSPAGPFLRASPLLRRVNAGWRRRLGLTRRRLGVLRHPATVWLLPVATLWFWHAAGPYDAAVGNEVIHVVEHASFLVTALLFWRAVVGGTASGRVTNGLGFMLLFTMALQSIFLSALLTFAGTPWYSAYRSTTEPWGLSPLEDQQLAGVIMWIPAGMVYVGAALALLVAWLRSTETETDAPSRFRA
ncbi:MAG TPA: cytochrome c oxidase assembly protein [Acidimicrobiia bacterium]|nr:cytochrome c oxidase assembly protein [Acidimicrobiia bacterium]